MFVQKRHVCEFCKASGQHPFQVYVVQIGLCWEKWKEMGRESKRERERWASVHGIFYSMQCRDVQKVKEFNAAYAAVH